jgi:murein DD-endopeptidase MepM/ murein hydrolase activator NlpD
LLVQAGDGVTQGQTISLAGSTGRSTGSHLDFRIRLNGSTFLNPLDFLP